MRSVSSCLLVALILTGAILVLVVPTARSQTELVPDVSRPCRSVLTEFGALQSEIVDLDLALERRLEIMRGAAPDREPAETRAVVELMAAQRTQVRDLLKRSHQQLTMHLIEHLTAGRESALECPLFRALKREEYRGSGDPGEAPLER